MNISINKNILVVLAIVLISVTSIFFTYHLFFDKSTSKQMDNKEVVNEKQVSQKENVKTISKVLNTSMELEKVSNTQETKLFAGEVIQKNITTIDSVSTELANIQKESVNNEIKKQEEIERKKKEEIAKKKAEEEKQRKIAEEKRKEAERKRKEEEARKNIITINGQKYKIVEVMNNMHITAYDNGIASTGKRPGDGGYGITASGNSTGWGSAAIDTRYHSFGDLFYIVDNHSALSGKPNGKLFTAHDTGSAIKGKYRMDIWFANHSEALRFGTQNMKVYKLRKL